MDIRKDYWGKKLDTYRQTGMHDVATKFAVFAEKYFAKNAVVLELGSGVGQDGVYFESKGHQVTQTDLTYSDLIDEHGIKKMYLDMESQWPFGQVQFDVVYAHLSLHYFTAMRTTELFDLIYNTLKPNGVVALQMNSIHDSEYLEGEEIEPDFRMVKGIKKRYFSVETLEPYVAMFEMLLLDENGEALKVSKQGDQRLVRFIGRRG